MNEELKKAAEEYAKLDEEGKWKDGGKYKGYIAGAERMKKQMMEEAVECELYYDGDFLAIDLNMAELGYSERDKVRIIVLPKED